MSRRTFIKQWNPAVPIGGRGRGRRKKGSDPDQAFQSAYRTVHDPSVEARRQGGRDAEAPARFYSASGLTAAGLPAPDDRFRAHTLSTRGGRGGIQQRVGMFRNAIQSNVIFGGPSERVLRHSRKKIDRLIAPESDVPESVSEWRPSTQRNTQRRRDVYEYESEEEEEEAEEEARYRTRRRVSDPKRHAEKRKDPEYDPYEFRDDDSGGEDFIQPSRPRRTNSRTVAGPSTSHAPTAYARERLRSKEERARPRRLFDAATDDEEEEEEGRRRTERHEPVRMERRNSKRIRDLSPSPPPAPAARHAITRRQSLQRRGGNAPTAAVSPSSTVRFREQVETDDGPVVEARSEANYTASIAKSIARRILSGLPPLRLKQDDGESYLSASRSIISEALDRFMDEHDEGGGSDPPGSDGGAARDSGARVMRALNDRTQHINVSDASAEEDGDESEREGGRRGTFEDIFSRHTRGDSPVLERLFDQTVREASNPLGSSIDGEEEEVDTAKMLGLGDDQQESGSSRTAVDPFATVPRTAGGSTSSGSDSASMFSHRSMVPRSMAEIGRSLATFAQPLREEQQQFQASDGSRSSSSHGSSGVTRAERSFLFQMNGSTNSTAPPSNFRHNNNDRSFNFGF